MTAKQEDAYDMGWRHGTEDIGFGWHFRPDRDLTRDEYAEYQQGYREARYDHGS